MAKNNCCCECTHSSLVVFVQSGIIFSDDLPKQTTKIASLRSKRYHLNSYDHILVAVCSALVYCRPSTSTPVEASLTDLGDALPPLAPARLGKLAKSTECGRSLSNPSISPWLGPGVAVGQRHADEFRSVCKMPSHAATTRRTVSTTY